MSIHQDIASARRRQRKGVIWRNSPVSFGRVSRLFHWTMAIAVAGMLFLGATIHWMTPSLSNLWLYGLHKSLGLTLLALLLLRLVWHRVTPPPQPIGDPHWWLNRTAVLVHRVLYALLAAVPVSGWVASSSAGLEIALFDRWILPPISPLSDQWRVIGFAAHGILTTLLVAVVALHVLGALRHCISRDGTLLRMTLGRAGPGPRHHLGRAVLGLTRR